MKNKDEQTGLVGLAIGAAVIGLVSAQRPIDRDSIVDELVRLGRQKGDGVEDEVFVKAAQLVRKGGITMAEVRHAQCHCGAVAFTVELTDGFNTARRCSCSFCRMRGRSRGFCSVIGNYRNQRRGQADGVPFSHRDGAAFLLLSLRNIYVPSASL